MEYQIKWIENDIVHYFFHIKENKIICIFENLIFGIAGITCLIAVCTDTIKLNLNSV